MTGGRFLIQPFQRTSLFFSIMYALTPACGGQEKSQEIRG
jgi:hypothetical protein